MNTIKPKRKSQQGYALLLVLAITTCAIILLAATINRSASNSLINKRTNDYAVAVNAAEGATEKVIARIAYDFQNYGLGLVTNNLGMYRTNVPTSAEDPYWTNFVFSDAQGNSNQTYVAYVTNYSGNLPSQYPGLFTAGSPVYRVLSNARPNNSTVTAAVQDDLLLALVPITQYAIFYNGLLEFSTCATMTVNGRVHANGAIYTGTSASLTFNGTVTTTSTISSPAWNGQGPSWANTGTYNGTPNYRTNVPTVSISVSSTNAHAIIDVPPAGESPTSPLGQTRIYNEAHVVLLVSNSLVTATLQNSVNYQVPGADPSPIILTSSVSPTALATNFPFLVVSNTFTDQRESKTVQTTEVDVAKYGQWVQTNSSILTKFPTGSGTYPTILYVGDFRTTNSSVMNGVRLKNGSVVPANGGLGWSVGTPNPLYVLGTYNCTNAAYLGTTNTTATSPSALMCDALTILSPSWSDSLSGGSLGSRNASSDTVNAAIIAGIVPSTGSGSTQFSGGVHNLPRLLESWTGQTLTLNTSIVNLYQSTQATHVFINPGTYYNPPTRQFSYDLNFANPAKQPPGVPSAMVAIRFNYALPPANNVTYNVTP